MINLENGKSIVPLTALWRWTTGSNNDTHHEERYIYIFVKGIDGRFVQTNFKISQNLSFRKNKDRLENEKFNKEFSHMFEDKLMARMLLTPYVQEAIINNDMVSHVLVAEYQSTIFKKKNFKYALIKVIELTYNTSSKQYKGI